MRAIREDGFWFYWYLIRCVIASGLIVFSLLGLYAGIIEQDKTMLAIRPIRECIEDLIFGLLIAPWSEFVYK